MSSVEQIWQVVVEEAEPAAPVGFSAFVFFVEETATLLEQRVWKGNLLLVTRKQIEDGDFWKEHDIVLAVSMNGGCFKDGPKAWFEYPVGRKALNIPIAYDEGRVPQMRVCLPFIMAALAAGKNVALHCLHTVHRGPVGLIALALTTYPKDIPHALPREVLRKIKEQWPIMSNATLQVTRPQNHRDARLWDTMHALLKEMPSFRVPRHIISGGQGVFTGAWTIDDVHIWKKVAQIIHEADPVEQLAQLELLLTHSQRGLLDGLPIAEWESHQREWQAIHNSGGKGKSKGKKGNAQNKGKGGKSGKSGSSSKDGKGSSSSKGGKDASKGCKDSPSSKDGGKGGSSSKDGKGSSSRTGGKDASKGCEDTASSNDGGKGGSSSKDGGKGGGIRAQTLVLIN